MEWPRPDRLLLNLFRLLPWQIRYSLYLLIASVVLLYPEIVVAIFEGALFWTFLVLFVVLPKIAYVVLTKIGLVKWIARAGGVAVPDWFRALEVVTLPIRILEGIASAVDTLLR